MNTTTRPTALALLTDALLTLMSDWSDHGTYGQLITEAYDAAEQTGQGFIAEAIEAIPFPDEDNDHGPWSSVLADAAADQIRAILRDELAL